jgi:hypothetical protein
MQFQRLLGFVSLQGTKAIGTALVLCCSGASAINIPEGTSKLQAADEIDKAYVVPLGLKGKPVVQAMATLQAEGFRCNLQHVSPIGLDEPPLSRCFKERSGFGSLCEELIVTLRFERRVGIVSRADLLKQLDTIKVASALPFCPYKRSVSAEYLATQSIGEQALVRYVEKLDLEGAAKKTYDTLLVEGFYCGFDADRSADAGANARKMVCTKVPSKIKFCFEARLVMDVEWPAGQTAASQLHAALDAAQVKAVHASCEVPSIKVQGERM